MGESSTHYSLPDELRHQLVIQRFCHRVASTVLANDPSSLLGNELSIHLTLLEKELSLMETQFWSEFSGANPYPQGHYDHFDN